MSDGEIARKIDELFDLRPKAIEDRLKLRNPIYQAVSYTHLDVYKRQTLHSLLTEKGVLIVAVPNCSSFDAKKYGAYWAAYDLSLIHI